MSELFDFLSAPRLDIRNQACKIVAGLTNDASNFSLLKQNNNKPILDLMKLTKDETFTAHDALSALINLSRDNEICCVMAETDFLHDLVLLMMMPGSVNADLCCMLLSNLSQHPTVINKLLPLENATRNLDVEIIDGMLDRFVKADIGTRLVSDAERDDKVEKKVEASFDFLAGVFANITSLPQGCQFFLSPSTLDGILRISKLLVFTEHKSLIRRGGCVSAIKNIAYSSNLSEKGYDVLLDPELDFLPYILLPICGPEDFEIDDIEELHEAIQFLPPTKTRETDAKLRILLLETLLAVASTTKGRAYLRSKGVYIVIKMMHLSEKEDDVITVIEELVNLLCRDEPGNVKVELDSVTDNPSDSQHQR